MTAWEYAKGKFIWHVLFPLGVVAAILVVIFFAVLWEELRDSWRFWRKRRAGRRSEAGASQHNNNER